MYTFSMASFTRSDSMSPFFARLAIRASLLAPELRHAMLYALVFGTLREVKGPRMMRVNLVRNGSVKGDMRTQMRRSFVLMGMMVDLKLN